MVVVLGYTWAMEDEEADEVMVEEASVVWVEERLVLEVLLSLLLDELTLEELVLEGMAVLLDWTGGTSDSIEIRGV